jgi:hypothetical protein
MSITLAKVFTLEELEGMKARTGAAMEAERLGKAVEAPKNP